MKRTIIGDESKLHVVLEVPTLTDYQTTSSSIYSHYRVRQGEQDITTVTFVNEYDKLNADKLLEALRAVLVVANKG